MNSVIEVVGLTKRYGPKAVVADLSFTVQPGRITGFLGPNGAGKSTTMRMMLGLDRPSAGTVTFGGVPYEHIADPLRTVGALLDAKALHPKRAARDHLLYLAHSNRIPRRRVAEVLARVGLTDVAGKRPGGFSLGMAQRLGIAAALLGEPRILILDEPVNGLDPEGIAWIREVMSEHAAQGGTVLVSSHLMSEMAVTADHLLVIAQGRLLADSGMAEFVDSHARSWVRMRTTEPERTADVLAGAGIRAERMADGGLKITGTDAGALGEIAADHRLVLHELTTKHASLEQAFLNLTASRTDYRAGAAEQHHTSLELIAP